MKFTDPNHILLVGNVAGALQRFANECSKELPTKVEPIMDENGNHTNQIRVMRASGNYLITIEEEADPRFKK